MLFYADFCALFVLISVVQGESTARGKEKRLILEAEMGNYLFNMSISNYINLTEVDNWQDGDSEEYIFILSKETR